MSAEYNMNVHMLLGFLSKFSFYVLDQCLRIWTLLVRRNEVFTFVLLQPCFKFCIRHIVSSGYKSFSLRIRLIRFIKLVLDFLTIRLTTASVVPSVCAICAAVWLSR